MLGIEPSLSFLASAALNLFERRSRADLDERWSDRAAETVGGEVYIPLAPIWRLGEQSPAVIRFLQAARDALAMTRALRAYGGYRLWSPEN